jgi:hypothetical protein
MTNEEIDAEIRKHGSYAEYRRQSYASVQARRPAPKVAVAKSKSEIALADYESMAAGRRLDLETFFKRNPDLYEEYRELATAK